MFGGTRSYEIARRLVLAGHSVMMLTTDRSRGSCPKKRWHITRESDIEVHWLSVPYSNNMGYFSRIIAFAKFMFAPVWRSRNFQPDIVLASSTPLTIAVPGVIISKWRNIPFVFEVRDLWPEIPIALGIIKNPVFVFLSQKLADFAYNNSDSVIALSPQMEEGVKNRGTGKYVKTITNGSDTNIFLPNREKSNAFREQYGISKTCTLITYAGTFGLVNGVSYIVQLAKKFENDGTVVFLLVGNGRDKDKVIDLADKIGCLNKNLFWIDNIPKEEMPNALAATDIAFSTIIPIKELEANSANKVFDGMASGCCIAINHKGWLKELLEENDTGISLSVDLDKAYIELQELIRDSDKLRLFKNNARKLAEKRFSHDILAKDVMAVLEKSLNK